VEEAVNRLKKDLRIRTGVRNESRVKVHLCVEKEILHKSALINKTLNVEGKLRKTPASFKLDTGAISIALLM